MYIQPSYTGIIEPVATGTATASSYTPVVVGQSVIQPSVVRVPASPITGQADCYAQHAPRVVRAAPVSLSQGVVGVSAAPATVVVSARSDAGTLPSMPSQSDLLQGTRLVQERTWTREEMLRAGMLKEDTSRSLLSPPSAAPAVVVREISSRSVPAAESIGTGSVAVEGPRVVPYVAVSSMISQPCQEPRVVRAGGCHQEEHDLQRSRQAMTVEQGSVSELALVRTRNLELEAELRESVSKAKRLEVQLMAESGRSELLEKEVAAAKDRIHAVTARAELGDTLELRQQQALTLDLQKQLQTVSTAFEQLKTQMAHQQTVSATLQDRLEEAGSSQRDVDWLRAQLADAQGQNEMLRLREVQLEGELRQFQSSGVSPAAEDGGSSDIQALSIALKRELQQVAADRDALKAELAKERNELSLAREQLAVAEARLGDDLTIRQPTDGNAALKKKLTRQLSLKTSGELFEAAASGHMAVLQVALAEADKPAEVVLKARDDEGRNLLHVALSSSASGSSKEMTEFLINEGQRWASGRKYMYSLQGALLERDIDRFVCGEDAEGRSPLSVLCMHKDAGPEVAVSLIEAHADPLQRSKRGLTPFLECARSGNIRVMQLLLQLTRGQVMLDADDSFRSGIHWAAASGSKDVVELLIKAKADAEVTDADGKTPKQLAEEASNDEIVQLLLSKETSTMDAPNDEDDDESIEIEDPLAAMAFAAGMAEGATTDPEEERAFAEFLRKHAAEGSEDDGGFIGVEV